MPEMQTPPAQEDTTREKEDEQTPPPKQKEDEQTPPSAPASKKAKKFLIPKLISSFEPKKGKGAGTNLFLEGHGKLRMAPLFELEPSKKKEAATPSTEVMPPSTEAPSCDVHVKHPSSQPLTLNDIRKPMIDDYVNVPNDYVPGRPILPWTLLDKIQWTIKRFHDYYMRAVHAGIHAISVDIPAEVFATGKEKRKAFVTFEDMHLLLNYRWLDVQLITIWCL